MLAEVLNRTPLERLRKICKVESDLSAEEKLISGENAWFQDDGPCSICMDS